MDSWFSGLYAIERTTSGGQRRGHPSNYEVIRALTAIVMRMHRRRNMEGLENRDKHTGSCWTPLTRLVNSLAGASNTSAPLDIFTTITI